MLTLVVISLTLTVITGAVQFSPGGPTVAGGSAPTVDAGKRFRVAAAELPFAVREPTLPPGWQASTFEIRAGTVRGAGPGPAVRTGWLTPQRQYLRLVQSTVEEGALVEAETGSAPAGRGTVAAGGANWVVYGGRRDEVVWVTDVAGVRLLLTGDARPGDFTTLAAAVLAAAPLPVS